MARNRSAPNHPSTGTGMVLNPSLFNHLPHSPQAPRKRRGDALLTRPYKRCQVRAGAPASMRYVLIFATHWSGLQLGLGPLQDGNDRKRGSQTNGNRRKAAK